MNWDKIWKKFDDWKKENTQGDKSWNDGDTNRLWTNGMTVPSLEKQRQKIQRLVSANMRKYRAKPKPK